MSISTASDPVLTKRQLATRLAAVSDLDAQPINSLPQIRRHAGGSVFASITPAQLHRAIALPRSVAERTTNFLFNS